MRNRKQKGQIIQISGYWYCRYWERRNVNGQIERKRLTYQLGPVVTRGKRPPADIVTEAAQYMATINTATIPPERIVTLNDFADRVYLPWAVEYRHPSTAASYRLIWEEYLRAICAGLWLRDVRTYHVQGWLNELGRQELSRNTYRNIKTVISGIFTLAKRQGYLDRENPARDAAISSKAKAPQETFAYNLDEIMIILSVLPEPAATVFATASFSGLRHGELMGLEWPSYAEGELYVTRNIWNGRVGEPKTHKSRAGVPVIQQLRDRLDMHRLRCGNPQSGPIFANHVGKPMSLGNLVRRHILPALNRCEICKKLESNHKKVDHKYKRDGYIPEWHGWHACRRGLGSNLKRLGVPDTTIQRILRHANVSTTVTYYIKTADAEVVQAMRTLENSLTDTQGTLAKVPAVVQ